MTPPKAGTSFKVHCDNTTRDTAHRRFALSVNLNDDFEGGELMYPEYGPRGYKPPMGAGVIFSCSLLHGVRPMRRGRRYAFLPYFYDDAAAAVREANAQFLVNGRESYRANPEGWSRGSPGSRLRAAYLLCRYCTAALNK